MSRHTPGGYDRRASAVREEGAVDGFPSGDQDEPQPTEEPRLSDLDALAARYRHDAESVYHTWFLHDGNRLKAFRAIRRGVEAVVRAVRGGTFG